MTGNDDASLSNDGRIAVDERQQLIERLRHDTTATLDAAGYQRNATDALIDERRRRTD